MRVEWVKKRRGCDSVLFSSLCLALRVCALTSGNICVYVHALTILLDEDFFFSSLCWCVHNEARREKKDKEVTKYLTHAAKRFASLDTQYHRIVRKKNCAQF